MSRTRPRRPCALAAAVSLLCLAVTACGGQPGHAPAASPAPSSAAQPASPAAAPAKGTGGTGSGATNPGRTPLTIVFSGFSAAYAPVWVAADQGFFTKEGIAPNIQSMADTAALAALLRGTIDMFVGTSGVSAIIAGAHAKLVADTLNDSGYAIYAAKAIPNLQGLTGRTVGGASPGSAATVAEEAMLQKAGISPSKVHILGFANAAADLAAMEAGKVVAGVLTPPATNLAAKAGFHQLATTRSTHLKLVNLPISVPDGVLQKKGSAIAAALRAIGNAERFMRSHPAQTEAIIEKHTQNANPSVAASAYKFFSTRWVLGPVSAQGLQYFVDYLPNKGAIRRTGSVTNMIDNSLVGTPAG